MHNLYITEIRIPQIIFLLLTLRVHLHSVLHSKCWKEVILGKLVHYGHSRSWKLVPIENLYAISY